MKEEYKNKENENKPKKVSELLKNNNLLDKKIVPHSVMLSNIEETITFYDEENSKENSKDKKSNISKGI